MGTIKLDKDEMLKKASEQQQEHFLYIYELREKTLYKLYGTDFYGDYGIFESTGDREYADKFKRYSYVKVYSTEPEVKIGIADFSGSIKLKIVHLYQAHNNQLDSGVLEVYIWF